MSTISLSRLPFPKESIIRLVFFQYSGRERFLCTSEGDTELENILREQNYGLKSTYGLKSISCLTSLKVHRQFIGRFLTFERCFQVHLYFQVIFEQSECHKTTGENCSIVKVGLLGICYNRIFCQLHWLDLERVKLMHKTSIVR